MALPISEIKNSTTDDASIFYVKLGLKSPISPVMSDKDRKPNESDGKIFN